MKISMHDGHKLFLGSASLLAVGALMLPHGGIVEVFGWHFIVGGIWWAIGFAAWAMTNNAEPTPKS